MADFVKIVCLAPTAVSAPASLVPRGAPVSLLLLSLVPMASSSLFEAFPSSLLSSSNNASSEAVAEIAPHIDSCYSIISGKFSLIYP